jgi:hypothetical protein
MKAVIEFGVSILLMALVTKNLPTILKQVHRGQYIILKEATVSKWGRPWVPIPMN